MNILRRGSSKSSSGSFGSSGKHTIQVNVRGENERAFQTQVTEKQLKLSLKEMVLVPFIDQCHQAKGTRIACSAVEVNDRPISSEYELERPLSQMIVRGETLVVTMTLESVADIQHRRKASARAMVGPTLNVASPKFREYSVERVSMMDGQDVVDDDAFAPLERLPQQGTMEAQQAMRTPTSVEQSMGMARPSPNGNTQSSQQRMFFLENDSTI